MEPATGLTILGTAVGSAKLVEKILGPTSEYLGDGLRSWTKKRVENTTRIFQHAAELLGDKVEAPGAVPPKILKGILEEGSFCDDTLSAEYFGGVLASARTNVARDDRGASFIALIGRLTTYQIRTHFIFYQVIKSLYNGQKVTVSTNEGRVQMRTFVPFSVYVPAMAFTYAEDASNIIGHVMFGLVRERLIEDSFNFGNVEYIKRFYSGASESGFIFIPSALGAELFLWAYGQGHTGVSDMLLPSLQFKNEEITIPAGSEPTAKPIKDNGTGTEVK